MPTATIDGLRLYYEIHGDSGEPLVFVHGYTGDITDWRHQIPVFSRHYRLLIMDLRGHGRSEATSDRTAYSIDRFAEDVEALVDHVGFGRYHLLGHSMGGAIVQEIALRSPDRLLSLTLEDTSFKFGTQMDPRMEAWRDERFRVAETQGMRAVSQLPLPMPPPPHMPAERLAEMAERLANMSVDAFIGAWEALTDWPGTADRAHQIKAPTLVIYGDLDAPALVKASERLTQMIPRATAAVIPECGHSPQWERPELFNEALLRHLRATGGGTVK